MTIRRLTPADAPAYRALALSGYAESPEAFTSTVREREPQPLAWWAERVSDAPEAASVVIGAWDGDRLVGVVGLRFETRERTRHKATLYGMVVSPEARGRGLGRRLVEAALEHLRQRPGIEAVTLTVREPNTAARGLYRACGFEAFGVEPLAVRGDGGGYVATVHMWRRVGA